MKTTWIFAIAFCLSTALSAQTTSPHPKVPFLLSAALPSYPDNLRANDVSGKVVAIVTVKGGQVIRVERPSGDYRLFIATRQNIETWKFARGSDAVFTVTFTYEIAGERSDEPMNPQVEMLPNLHVNLTVRP
jgi:hypothetical protein